MQFQASCMNWPCPRGEIIETIRLIMKDGVIYKNML